MCAACGAGKEAETPTQVPAAVDAVVVPDVKNVDEADAKNVLSSMGLIPVVTYAYDDATEAGAVISSSPKAGESAEKGTKVTLSVSKGPKTAYASNSYMNWTYIGSEKDDWEFNHPYIEDGVLYIQVTKLTFGTDMEWRDRYNNGYALGTASVNDSFDKVVPITLTYKTRTAKAGQPQECLIAVPLVDLDVTRPTDMYFRVGISVYGEDEDLCFNISMTW